MLRSIVISGPMGLLVVLARARHRPDTKTGIFFLQANGKVWMLPLSVPQPLITFWFRMPFWISSYCPILNCFFRAKKGQQSSLWEMLDHRNMQKIPSPVVRQLFEDIPGICLPLASLQVSQTKL